MLPPCPGLPRVPQSPTPHLPHPQETVLRVKGVQKERTGAMGLGLGISRGPEEAAFLGLSFAICNQEPKGHL